jgi:Zn-dependent protease
METTPPAFAPAPEPPPEERPLPNGFLKVRAEVDRPPRTGWSGLFLLSLVAFLFVRSATDPVRSAVVLAAVLFFHELGHVAAMRLTGHRDVKVFFVPFFGALTTARAAPGDAWRDVVVSLAGPVPGLLLAGALLLSPARNVPLAREVGVLALALNAFNLLPLGFLDGGRVLGRVLFQRHPLLEGLFASFSALAFAGLAVWWRDAVLGGLALLTLLGVPVAYRRARAARALRGRVTGDGGDFGALPLAEQLAVFEAAEAAVGPQATVSVRAAAVRDLHHRATRRPASLLVTLGAMGAWLGSVALVLVVLVGMALSGPRRPRAPQPGRPAAVERAPPGSG